MPKPRLLTTASRGLQVTFRNGRTQQFSCVATSLVTDPAHAELLLAAWVYTKWRAFVGRRVYIPRPAPHREESRRGRRGLMPKPKI